MEDQILNIYPISLYKCKIPNKFSYLSSLFNFQQMTETHQHYGNRSVNSYILDLPECKDLSNFILDKVQNYSYNILGFETTSYKFTQSWVSHKPPKTYHQPHTHPNSFISGVFFFGKKDNNTSKLQFNPPKWLLNTIWVPVRKDILTDCQKLFLCEFIPGDLILFPSWLEHEVPFNQTQEVRKSIAFNCIPSTGFGLEEDLTELKL